MSSERFDDDPLARPLWPSGGLIPMDLPAPSTPPPAPEPFLVASGGLASPPLGAYPPWALREGHDRPLADAMPVITRGKMPCWHRLPPPTKGTKVSCTKCRRTFKAKFKRPPRQESSTCFDCGHTTPKGPKRPKEWTWVDIGDWQPLTSDLVVE